MRLSALRHAGYEIIDSSVHDKNQERFTHLSVQKDDKRYFCKINKTTDVYREHLNSSLGQFFKDVPSGIEFLTPVDTLIDGGLVFHIYPYIQQRPISNESKNFKDFSVPEDQIDVFLYRVIVALRCVERQNVITTGEENRGISVEEEVLHLLKIAAPSAPHGLNFLQQALKYKGQLEEMRLALYDVQPQNMFWLPEDEGKLILFDFEAMHPRRRGYDFTRFFTHLWVVYNRSEIAKRFMKRFLASMSTEERTDFYPYLHYNLLMQSLLEYTAFKDSSRQRAKKLMEWIQDDFLLLVNQANDTPVSD